MEDAGDRSCLVGRGIRWKGTLFSLCSLFYYLNICYVQVMLV
jgi:hypothetical protein